ATLSTISCLTHATGARYWRRRKPVTLVQPSFDPPILAVAGREPLGHTPSRRRQRVRRAALSITHSGSRLVTRASRTRGTQVPRHRGSFALTTEASPGY